MSRYLSKISIRVQLLAAVSLFIAVTSLIFFSFSYNLQKRSLLKGIDEKLYTAANFALTVPPESYHDNIVNSNSVKMEDYLQIVDSYNKLCSDMDLQYIWSVIEINKQIRFATGTSTSKDVTKGDHALFFDIHTDPESFSVALETGEPHYSSFKNRWGDGRMVLIPMTDKHDRQYVIGASMNTDEVNVLLGESFMLSAALFAVVLLVGIVFSSVIARSISKPIVKLKDTAESIANGDREDHCSFGGSSEICSLSKSLNNMALSIEDKVKALESEVLFRKRAQKELTVTRNYITNIINSMPSVMIGVDPEHTVTQWNTQAELSTGVSAEEAIGLEVSELLPRLSSKLSGIDDSIKTNSKQVYQKELVICDGKRHFEDITIYPLVSDTNSGAVIRIDDITERALFDSVVQDEKMKSITGLAAGMAHEINNPLAAITQGIQNTFRRLDPASDKNVEISKKYDIDLVKLQRFLVERKIMTFLKGGHEAVIRAAEIVKNMMMFCRKAGTRSELVNPMSLIENTIRLGSTDYDMKTKYDFKFVDIIREYDERIPEINCCTSEIEQVVLNLFKNGLQAMGEMENKGFKPEFHIRLKNEDRYIRIEVEDNGPGISDRLRRRIFDPFFTTKPTGSEKGLGLAVSYSIITQNHGGTFEVESEVGVGTKFIIRLPVQT